MPNEFRHVTVGAELTQAEYESITGHAFASQATGDLMYASSATQLTRLGIGSTDQVLIVTGGIPAWSSTITGRTWSGGTFSGTIAGTPTFSGVVTFSTGAKFGPSGNAFGRLIFTGGASVNHILVTPSDDSTPENEIFLLTNAAVSTQASLRKNGRWTGKAFTVVETTMTIGSAGSVVIPRANMSGAANDAARDVLAGNLDGAIAADTGVAGRLYLREGGVWRFVLLS